MNTAPKSPPSCVKKRYNQRLTVHFVDLENLMPAGGSTASARYRQGRLNDVRARLPLSVFLLFYTRLSLLIDEECADGGVF